MTAELAPSRLPVADAVRSDGGLVRIRPAQPADEPALASLHERASDNSLYLRFFTYGRATAQDFVATLGRPNSRDHVALVASVSGDLVGEASFERVSADGAEFALLVADDRQAQGIGTLLIEHLASAARLVGIHHFQGDVLMQNSVMIDVLRNIGFDLAADTEGGVVHFEFSIDPTSRFADAQYERERAADAASLQSLLAPRVVAVIGAGARAGTVGHEVLLNIRAAQFRGKLFVVNPKHRAVLGVPCVASALDLPEVPDLAIVAVPADAVPEVIVQCGERGARAILLLSAGFGEFGEKGKQLQARTVEIAREYGMRLVGPNCVGVVNTDPAVKLNATFGPSAIPAGPLGVLSQSGAFGLGFARSAARAGLGVSQFVSIGNKADVSGNDMLLYWANDPHTAVIGMYLESIRDASRFQEIARRISLRKPILLLKSGRTEAGRRAGASHTAAAASPEVAVDALCRAAGIIRLDTTEQLVDAARVLAATPPPAGNRIAIVGNSGGPGILAADAAAAAGLTVVEFDGTTRAAIAAALPKAASTQNPVDLGAAAGSDDFARALRIVAESGTADAILTIFTDVAVTDPATIRRGLVESVAQIAVPLVSVEVGAEDTLLAGGTGRDIPVFSLPERAAAAVGVAARYGAIRARSDATTLPRSTSTADRVGRAVVDDALRTGAGWLDPLATATLLTAYGIPVCAQHVVNCVDDATAAAGSLGYPVVLKLTTAGAHKSDIGGVRLNIGDADTLRTAFAQLSAIAPGPLLIQQMMHGDGRELIVGAVRDPNFGPLVMVGAGGTLADVLDDRAFRLAPVTPAEADEALASLRISRVLDGLRGADPVPRNAIRDVVVATGQLVADLPSIVELDLNPLVCRPQGVVAVDARVRVDPHAATPDRHVPRLYPLST